MFIIERIVGLEILPYYAGLYKITTLVLAISGLVTIMFFPYISQSFAKGEINTLKDFFKKNIIFSNGISISISLVLLLSAPYFVPIWLGHGSYLGSDVFGLMLLIIIIYTNNNAFANSIIAIGANYFIYPAIFSSILSISFAIIGGLNFGIIGVIAGNIIGVILPSLYIVLWSYNYIKKIN